MSAALSRRHFLAGAATLSAALAGAAPALALPAAEQQLGGLMDKLWDEQLRRFPETATACGADVGRNAALRTRLDPWSREAREDWVGWAQSAIRRLEAIDATALPQATLVNRAVLLDHFGKIARLGTRYRFGAAASDASAPVAPYAISPATGPHRAIPDLLEAAHPVECKADCEAWLERLAAFPRALDAATAAFRSDAAAGVLPSAAILDATLAQLGALRVAGAMDPLARRLAARADAAGLSGDWSRQADTLLVRAVQPALERQMAALALVRPSAQQAAGVWSLHDGDAFYADALTWHTGSALGPDAVHALGSDRVAQLAAELDAVLTGLGLAQGTIAERMAALRARPGEVLGDDAAGRAAVAARTAEITARVQAELPGLFVGTPLGLGLADQERAAAEASGPSAGGSRFAVATTVFHDRIAQQLWTMAGGAAGAAVPAIRRRGTRYGATVEGWSLYTEQVLDEQGLYASDPASRAGYLHRQLQRSAAVVMDTGLHARRWTPEQARGYLVNTTGESEPAARAAVEQACITPGRACAGVVGQAEWQRLRALARTLAGRSFDQRQFHRLVEHGRAPFGVLEDVVVASFTRRLSVLAMRKV